MQKKKLKANKIWALLISFVILCAAIAILFSLAEVPMSRLYHGQELNKRAAFAIRDDVIPFQKFGSKLFTVPYLENCYDRSCYFTEYFNGQNKEAFIDSLSNLLTIYSSVDIFLLAHSNKYYEWVEEIDADLTKNIRMVYNTGCGNSGQSVQWLALGADSYVGHVGSSSMSPVFYLYFLRRWANGETLAKSVEQSNNITAQKLDWIGKISPGFPSESYIDNTRAIISGKDKINLCNE